MAKSIFAAFLYGQNIPGRRYLTGRQVQELLLQLAPKITFVDFVSRPDSILLLSESSTTEQSIREALRFCFNCKNVVLTLECLRRIVTGAKESLRSIKEPSNPPYRMTTQGIDWEWCIVLCSEQLPVSIGNGQSLFMPTSKVVPLCVLDRRALLVRKRRKNTSGTRITLGSILNQPFEQALERRGITIDCLTSRTLNQTDKVLRVADATRITTLGGLSKV